jgi:hypothetical protein
MKWIFVVLFLANIGLFGWEKYRDLRKTVTEPAPARPIPEGTERLVLLRELDKLPPPRPDGANSLEPEIAPSPPAPENLSAGQDPVTSLEAETPPQQNPTCLAVGPFATEGEAALAASWFENRNAKTRQRTEEQILTKRFWVYLEPQASREAAQQKLAELQQKGVQDILLVQANDMRNAISLGLYGDQDSVTRRLARLNALGYQPKVLPRHKVKQVIWLDVLTELDIQVMAEARAQFETKVPAAATPCQEIASQPLNP